MTAAYASVQALLAQGSEYFPDAQAGRDLYFLGKAQATILPSISSPAIGYQSRMHLLPSTDRVGYGRLGVEKGLQDKLSEDIPWLMKRKEQRDRYGSHFGYLVPQREIEKANQYLQ